MRLLATYAVETVTTETVLIRDIGSGRTVTNDAEAVVEDLHRQGYLDGVRRLLYYDSYGELGELKYRGSRFVGFGPARGL